MVKNIQLRPGMNLPPKKAKPWNDPSKKNCSVELVNYGEDWIYDCKSDYLRDIILNR